MTRRLLSLAAAVLFSATLATTAACDTDLTGGEGKDPAASPSVKVPTAEELRSGLLELSDLPSGYSVKEEDSAEPEDSSSASAGSDECEKLFNQFDAERAAGKVEGKASVKFQKAPSGPFVNQTLESYPDPEGLQRDLTRIRETVDKCREFTVKNDDGGAIKVKMKSASFPKLGDDSEAFRLTATVTSGGRKLTIGGYLVAARIGSVACTIASFGLPSVDADELETIVRKAIEKVVDGTPPDHQS